MKRNTGLIAIGMAFTATIGLAHNGATGVVLERMNGMTALRDVIRDLTPIIQGVEPYEALTVSKAGKVIAAHSGETMRALFPDNSLSGVTYAKPNIWSEWQEFASLADDLRIFGETLTKVAPVGLQPPEATSMLETDTTVADTQGERSQKIATLMGYAATNFVESASSTVSPQSGSAPRIAMELGAEEVFAKISGTCSACHAKFRNGRN